MSYFDTLPDELLLILLKKDKKLRFITESFKHLFEENQTKIKQGLINPNEYFSQRYSYRFIEVSLHGPIDVSINGNYIDIEVIEVVELINKYLKDDKAVIYLYEMVVDYSGYIDCVCQLDGKLHY